MAAASMTAWVHLVLGPPYKTDTDTVIGVWAFGAGLLAACLMRAVLPAAWARAADGTLRAAALSVGVLFMAMFGLDAIFGVVPALALLLISDSINF